jgi:NTE family protein
MGRAQRRQRRQLLREMREAQHLDTWRIAANRLDAIDGNDVWRSNDVDAPFDGQLLARDVATLANGMSRGDVAAVESSLTETLHRHHHEVTAPENYGQTHTGEPRQSITTWLDACEAAIDWLATVPIPGLTDDARHARFARARANLGTTALMLSGGGAWGLYHLGVVRALQEADLLPTTLCGSSMGAIIAAGVGTRTDEALDALYADPSQIHRVAVRVLTPAAMAREGAVLSPAQLEEHVVANVGMSTFAEAYAKTGRVLNVTVSPTRARQKPRVLSHVTAPDVLIADATVASCSLPGLFRPVTLRQRLRDGSIAPYAATEQWVDGSMHGDLPLRRMARLHNVNHFVVSQANPFVLPFVTRHRRDPVTRVSRFAGSIVRASTAAVLDETRRRMPTGRTRAAFDMAHALAAQDYVGDVNIHPHVPPGQYLRVMANPSLQQLHEYIRGGERATWPRLAAVRDQTRITRALERVMMSLRSA